MTAQKQAARAFLAAREEQEINERKLAEIRKASWVAEDRIWSTRQSFFRSILLRFARRAVSEFAHGVIESGLVRGILTPEVATELRAIINHRAEPEPIPGV